MIDSNRVLDAVKSSSAKKVALIDDAFDAPAFVEAHAPALIGYLEDETAADAISKAGVGGDISEEVQDAINKGQYSDEVISDCFSKLYEKYKVGRDTRFDPGNIFRTLKGDNLEALEPLIALLSKCQTLHLVTIGRSEDYVEKAGSDVHIIFADFYLIGPDDLIVDLDTNSQLQEDSIEESLKRVNELVSGYPAGERPSVVMMSSKDVAARAEEYRGRIRDVHKQDLLYKSQFFFLAKNEVKITDGESGIVVEQAACESLLDVFQSFEFGRALNGSLDAWLEATRKSVARIRDDVVHLTLKDFAYLIKFRLGDEGQNLLDYLEWFFGQCLLDRVGKSVDQLPDLQKWSDALEKSAERVEGAFDGATRKVGELYHHVRVEDPRNPSRNNYRMGDLYLIEEAGRPTILAVITPDCDLIVRDGDRNAKRLTTVSGKLTAYNAPTASVSNFLVLYDEGKGVPHNVNWDLKSIRTWDLEPDESASQIEPNTGGTATPPRPDTWPLPNASDPSKKFIGTLRSLYAQQLQRDVLHDFGRVGVPVAPAIAMAASCKVSVRKKAGIVQVQVGDDKVASCWIILGRHRDDRPRVIFARGFVTNLLKVLGDLDPESMTRQADMAHFKQPEPILELYDAMCRNGVLLGKSAGYGIEVTQSRPKGAPGEPICWIVLTKADDPAETDSRSLN